MHGNMLSAPAGQVAAAPSLLDLATDIRTARADAASCFSDGLDRVREIGGKLKIAKKIAGHGRWGEFLKACNLNSRTAAQYMKLADLAAKSVPAGTDLTGMSIKAAIRCLTPPRSPRTTPPIPRAVPVNRRQASAGKRTGHIDIIGAWLAASPAECARAVDGIGLDAIFGAIPSSWWPLLEEHLAERRQSPAAPLVVIDDPFAIPDFLDRREAPAKVITS